MSPSPPLSSVQAALALLDPLARTHGMSPAVAISVRAARKQVALLVSQGISAPLLERAIAALRQALDVAQTNDRTQDQSQAATCARILGHLVEAQQSLASSAVTAPGEGTAALPAEVLASYAEQAKRLVPRPAHEVPDLEPASAHAPPALPAYAPPSPAAPRPPVLHPSAPQPPVARPPVAQPPIPQPPRLEDLRLPTPAALPLLPSFPPAPAAPSSAPRAPRVARPRAALPPEAWLEATAPLAELLGRRPGAVAQSRDMTPEALDGYDERLGDRLQALRWLADDAGWPEPWPAPESTRAEAHLLALLAGATDGPASSANASANAPPARGSSGPTPPPASGQVPGALTSCAREDLPCLVQALRLFVHGGRARSWAKALAGADGDPLRQAVFLPFLLENGALPAGALSRIVDALDDEAATEASRWLPWGPSRGEGATWLLRAAKSPPLLAARLTHAAVAHAVPGAFERARRAVLSETDDEARLVYAEALTLRGDHTVMREELDPLLDDDERQTLFPDLFDPEGALTSSPPQRLLADAPWSVNAVMAALGSDRFPVRVQERLALDLQLRTGTRSPAPFLADAGARVRLEALALWRHTFEPIASRFRPGAWAVPLRSELGALA